MTGLLEPEAVRDQGYDKPGTRWAAAPLAIADFAGSVLLGAIAIWLVVLVLNVARDFVIWRPVELPAAWTFRAALVIAIVLECRGRFRKAREK